MSKKPVLKLRPAIGARTVVPDAAADALVASHDAKETGAQTPERPNAQTAAVPTTELPNIQTPGRPDSRIVARSGRLRADGTRTGARELRRSTIYLPPALAKQLDMFAVEHGRDRSDVIGEALAAWLRQRS